jgi:hypothetical protein
MGSSGRVAGNRNSRRDRQRKLATDRGAFVLQLHRLDLVMTSKDVNNRLDTSAPDLARKGGSSIPTDQLGAKHGAARREPHDSHKNADPKGADKDVDAGD